jgi:hypothetical protein
MSAADDRRARLDEVKASTPRVISSNPIFGAVGNVEEILTAIERWRTEVSFETVEQIHTLLLDALEAAQELPETLSVAEVARVEQVTTQTVRNRLKGPSPMYQSVRTGRKIRILARSVIR